jgi:acetylornithine/N-succinyldiaminopimelate aminotransferase
MAGSRSSSSVGRGRASGTSRGNEYLDFVGGVAVNVLGHSHPAVVAAIADQAARVIHTSNLFYTTPMIELARLLVERSGLDRAFFCNSGTEAVEAAIKLARRWGHDTRGGGVRNHHHHRQLPRADHGFAFGDREPALP